MTNQKFLFALLFVLSFGASSYAGNIYHKGWIDFNKNGKKDVYEDSKRNVDERIEDLLSQMTMEEKTCQLATLYGSGRVLKDAQPTEEWKNRVWKDGIANIDEELNGVGSFYESHYKLIYPFSNHVKALHNIQRWFVEETRLGIPVEFSNEGIHGLNHTKATPLPSPIAIGSTWNKDLAYKAGVIAGKEAKLMGYHSVYAPILDVARDQRWGRVLECYGEEPFIVAQMGTQMARGIEEQGIASGLKHYAAYGTPKGGRDAQCRTDPHITPRELHELFLYPFKEVIKNANPHIVMSSYNDWNGEPVSASHYFLTELLRDTYGFNGYVVSDSEAVEFIHTKHQIAPTYADGTRLALEAGLNVRTHFTEPEMFVDAVREQIKEGKLKMDVVDQRVRQVLAVKFYMGLFDNPYTGDGAKADKEAGIEKNMDFVNTIGEESIVLLKNNGILPLQKKDISSILVTGPLACETDFMSSRYGPNGLTPVTVLDGLRAYLKNDAVVNYEKGCDVIDKNWPESQIIPQPLSPEEEMLIDKAVKAASGVDVVIAVMGQDNSRTGESRSQTSLDLPGRQRDLLMALYKTGKPVVLVLINGQPLTINWENRYLPAILETWFPSCEGGNIIAKMLFGDVNPSGKLTITFPKSMGQIEYNFPFKKGSHGVQNKKSPNGEGRTRVLGPLYPFGYGLSYTKFEYSGLSLAKCADGSVDVKFTVTNTGKMDGAEIAQIYIRDCYSSVVTYDSQLRGFEKVFIKAGESAEVSVKLPHEAFQILDKDMKWTVEPGDFDILVGASSSDLRLKGTVRL